MRLWFGLFGAAASWLLQELLSYGVVAHGCLGPGALGLSLGGATLASGVLLLVGVLALLVAAAARRSGHERSAFMGLGGVVISGTFVLGLLANFVVLFLVPACV